MKVYSVTICLLACCVSSLAIASRGASISAQSCAPSTELQTKLEKAAAIGLATPFAAEPALAAFRALRDQYPSDIFVQEGYQDAVQRYGVEGQLKALTEEYQKLEAQNSGNRLYHYLYLRSLVGYSTGAAIQGLTEMAAQYPDFAPAHQTLVAIYGSATFRDAVSETVERQKLLLLCPKASINPLPPLPGPSLLLDQAEAQQSQHGDPEHILAMTAEGMSQEEWRWERIHPHDWYTDDEKRKTLRDVRRSYWEAWAIQVRCYRNMGQPDKVDALLTRMDRSAPSFAREPGQQYWDALATLVQLYAEGKQWGQVNQKLDLMTAILAKKSDAAGEVQLKQLKSLLTP